MPTLGETPLLEIVPGKAAILDDGDGIILEIDGRLDVAEMKQLLFHLLPAAAQAREWEDWEFRQRFEDVSE